jgi:hypothetical protein
MGWGEGRNPKACTMIPQSNATPLSFKTQLLLSEEEFYQFHWDIGNESELIL